LAALKDFYAEKDSHQKLFDSLKDESEANHAVRKPLSMDAFVEDWNASQFWYTDGTARKLAEELLDGVSKASCVAVISAPSVFLQLKNILSESESGDDAPQLALLEFDDRFGVFKEFVHYDYLQPMRVPPELRGKFDRIIVDPPFLSEDCQTKAAMTVRLLAKSWTISASETNEKSPLKLISCTGERMETLIHRLYGGVGIKTTDFEIEHARGLSNEFRCYANFPSSKWTLK
jgi:hypothetical protein